MKELVKEVVQEARLEIVIEQFIEEKILTQNSNVLRTQIEFVAKEAMIEELEENIDPIFDSFLE